MRKNLLPLGEKKSCPDAKIKHYDTHFVTQKTNVIPMLVSQVACETVTKTGMIMVCGEITSKAHVDYQKVITPYISFKSYQKSLVQISLNRS